MRWPRYRRDAVRIASLLLRMGGETPYPAPRCCSGTARASLRERIGVRSAMPDLQPAPAVVAGAGGNGSRQPFIPTPQVRAVKTY